MKEFDVIVLGGGTAGTMAAKTAAANGASTVMFNDGELGGLCILRGCMPTKTMLHAAHLNHHARHHATPGIGKTEPSIEFAQVMDNKDAKVKRFKDAKIAGIEKGGYQVIDARAHFTGADTVEAAGEAYRFTKGAVISTGSVVSSPPIPGLDQVPFLTSDEVMELREQPESIIVLGSGAIGLEFAQFYARMGTQVHLVSRRAVFTDAGPIIAQEMRQALDDEPNLHAHHPAVSLGARMSGEGIALDIEDAQGMRTITAEHLLVATGRRADVDGLGLEQAGVEMERGKIRCGANMQTSNPKIFVAGDASGFRLLLHVANWEGQVAGLGAAKVSGEHLVENRLNMSVVFTDPPLALLGMTESEAQSKGIEALIAQARFPETGRAITMDVEHGVWTLVCDQQGEILGTQILGPRADDLIHILSGIMYYRGKVQDLIDMPWYHPTLAEVLIGLARDLTAKLPG